MARRPRKYSPELKAEVVKAVLEGGLSYTEAARDFDLVAQTVHNWVTAEKKKRAEESPTATRGQVGELERRIRELEQENAFLKKAAAFFAKEQR
ncbi:transposase [Amycolatopsis thermalba]|uniref:Transposase n=2 Tax=Amycolatopsis TaxID=1813 RepID=A0ABY4P451_9PSEU|nr:transposase [Amycolatopsis thermalba]UQS21469.1 transposase [Amycolatopsis thermalba]UQS27047.1 transposase [Amycolatopsis thermalba]